MKTLFLRIFLWFWFAMAAVTAVLVITSPMFTRSRPRVEHWQRSSEEMLRNQVEMVAGMLEHPHDAPPPPPDFHPHGRRPPHQTYIFDEQLQELSHQKPPAAVEELARHVAATGQAASQRDGSLHLYAQPASASNGEARVIVGTFRRPPQPLDLLEPSVLLPRLLALVVLVGGLSLLLSRHLTKPLRALRRATLRLSEGDLDVRVGAPITKRRDEIGGLARDFDAMAERVSHLVAAQQRLLRDVSHELRSPLARQNVALTLARGSAHDQLGQWLDRIEVEGERLATLIGQLLTLTRSETAAAANEPEFFELLPLLEQVKDDAEIEAQAKVVTITHPPPSTCILRGSRHLLRSALENVVRNAVRYTKEGTTVELAVSVTDDIEPPTLQITVRDNGPGVPSQHLPRLFEAFYRVEDARDRQLGGTGLGLAIAAKAVRVHGGTVTASNHPDGGLIITITLPLERT